MRARFSLIYRLPGYKIISPLPSVGFIVRLYERKKYVMEPGIVGKRPVNPPVAVADETYGSVDEQGLVLMLRKTAQDWVLIAVNEHKQGVSFTISGLPKELEGRNLYRLYSDETHLVKNRGLHDGIRSFGVHVFATSRRFEAE